MCAAAWEDTPSWCTWGGPHMKKRPLIRDMYHGLYQVVVSSQLVVGLHRLDIVTPKNNNATYAINFTDRESLLRAASSLDAHWFTLPIHPLIARQLPALATTAQLPTTQGHCSDAQYDIENEWSGEWIRLGLLVNTSAADNGTSAREESRCPANRHFGSDASSSSKLVFPICTGEFPYNLTSPTSFTMPWVYSRSSCLFHQYSVGETLSCLDNAWLLVVGDSNMQDWKRNFVGLLLGARHLWRMEQGRATDDVWTLQPPTTQPPGSTTPPRQSHVRITQVWDGHHDSGENLEGLFTFRFASMQSRLRSLFDGSFHMNVSGADLPPAPSHVIFVSGLHDAFAADDLDRVGGWTYDLPAERLIRTLDEPVTPLFKRKQLVDAVPMEPRVLSSELIGLPVSSFRLQVRLVLRMFDELSRLHPSTRHTQFVWRSSVSPLISIVPLNFRRANIWTIRLFNAVVVNEIGRYARQHNSSDPGIRWLLNDQYDLTYPWSNTAVGLYSDGAHYGRKPPPSDDGSFIANSFIGIMQLHVSVNMMCNQRTSSPVPISAVRP